MSNVVVRQQTVGEIKFLNIKQKKREGIEPGSVGVGKKKK